MIPSTPSVPPSFAAVSSVPPAVESPRPPSVRLGTAAVVRLTLSIGVVSIIIASVVGGLAGFTAFQLAAADGDPGEWDTLGSFVVGALVFIGVGFVAYLVAVIQGIKRRVPSGDRTLAAFLLVGLTAALPVMAVVGAALG